ncbi:SPOCS domain-containing protein [Clostridium sp.]|uniref:DUF3794 and LysM peptidoglycan-binding domain-containing protein n=1 Tax=Clostridium sp. TaxID=1506 RepID=UPI00346429A9
MAELELQKENIEYERLLGEGINETVVKGDFLIPDTHPDVAEILMLDVRPVISNKEVMQDKVYLEGQLNYNILYLAREDESMGVHSVNYSDKFTSYIDVSGAEHRMTCNIECYAEHINCSIINERKVGVEGIITLKSQVLSSYTVPIIKEVVDSDEIQMLRRSETIDRLVGRTVVDLKAKSDMQISMDKPQVDKLLKYDTSIHKREVTISQDKINVSAFVKINVLYRASDSQDIFLLEDDVYVNKEVEMDEVDSSMISLNNMEIQDVDVEIRQDDLGENRLIGVEANLRSEVSVMAKDKYDFIEDAYCSKSIIDIEKEKCDINVLHGHNCLETIVKDNIEISKDSQSLASVIMSKGDVVITDKKLVEDKILVEGIVRVNTIYRTNKDEKSYGKAYEEMNFSSSVDIQGAKIDMQSMVRTNLESLEASIEADTIAVKAVVQVCGQVMYTTSREILTSITKKEEAIPEKKASITIYIVQPGDTLWSIAKKYFTTVDQLMALNSLENVESIRLGDKLLIPGRAIL